MILRGGLIQDDKNYSYEIGDLGQIQIMTE